jgi:PPE-repeat protein
MIDRNRIAAAAFGLLAVGAAVAFPATAVADPPPDPLPLPADPAPPPPPPGPTIPVIGAPMGPAGFGVLAQNGIPSVPGALGAPPVYGLDAASVLAQAPAPSLPGAVGTPPNLNVFNNAYGAGALNEVPAAPGKGEQFDVAPGQENADVSRREWLGRYIDLYRAGDLKGGLLGQMPQEQLGEPLPGTAPPPGTNVPPGLAQFLPDPADAAPPPPPPPG